MTDDGAVIEIILADDHTLLRQGLRALLDAAPDLRVVGEAARGDEALRMIERRRPRVAVVDFSMFGLDGVGIISAVRSRDLPTRVLLLTMHKERSLARRAMDAGASGVVLKDDAYEQLADAIRKAAAGEIYVSEELVASPTGSRGDDLSPREREVLSWIARGHSNREVARELSISVKTVETHRARLMAKLELHSSAELTRYAIRVGLVEA